MHAAQLLGRVTHSANNHSVVVAEADGTQVTRTCRDSADAPRAKPRHHAPQPPVTQPPAKPVPRAVRPWQPPDSLGIARTRRPSRAQSARASEREHLHRRVLELGGTLHAPAGRPAAADRLQALRARVLARNTDAL